MKQKYNVNYKTFDELMSDVADDLSVYDDQGYLNPDKYIKIVQKVNSDLSVKINPVFEDVIYIEKGRGLLPENFKLLNSAYICYNYEITKNLVGTTISYETTPVSPLCPSIEFLCRNPDYKCTPYQVWKKAKKEVINIMGVLRVSLTSSDYCSESCNTEKALNEMSITKEGDCYYINTAFQDGKVYIEYISQMLDDEGNILILDHPLTTEYYEYEIKMRILEDLWLNGQEEVLNRLKYIKEEVRKAKIIAKNFVNTFDFSELKQVYYANRRRMAEKYFRDIM